MSIPTRIATLVALASAASALLPAGAEADGPHAFTVSTGVGLNYDENLFRLPSGQSPPSGLGATSRGDLAWNVFVDAAFRVEPGRQVLRGDLNLATTRYARYSFLNYQSLNGIVADDWRLGGLFSGTLSYEQRQSVSSFADVHNFQRNLNTVRALTADNEAWVLPDWHVTAGYSGTTVENSNSSVSSSNLQENAFDAGIKYLTSRNNYLRLALREARGRYPNAEFVAGSIIDNRYDQTDIGLDYYQAPTGASALTARIAYTSRRSPELPQRDFSGPTGRISWDYAATGKTGFNLLLRREIGAYTDLVTNYVVTEAVSIAPYWRLTAKVRLDGSYERQRRDYRGDPQFAATGQPREVDLLTLARLSVTYEPARRWRVVAGWQYSTRSSNQNGLNFSDQSFSLNAQYTWD